MDEKYSLSEQNKIPRSRIPPNGAYTLKSTSSFLVLQQEIKVILDKISGV